MSIEVILAPMFSGKTAELQNRFRKTFQKHPDSTICFIPSIDTRYSRNALSVSHDGSRIYARRISSLESDPEGIEDIEYFFIDEGQFIAGLADFCIRMKRAGKHVCVAGLNSTYKGEAWPEIAKLVPVHVTHYTALKAVCVVCRKEANYSRRLNDDGDDSTLVDVGGGEKYVATCLEHFDNTVVITPKMIQKQNDVLDKLRV